MLRASRIALCFAIVGAASLAGLTSAQPATAGKYSYYNSISCGTLSPVRTAGVSSKGDYSAKFSLSGYSFKWKDARSELHYSACGSAAPYGQFPAPARRQKLKTEFRVSSVTLKNCKAENTVSIARNKKGGKVANSFTTSCNIGSKVQKRILRTSSKSKPARLIHGGTVEMSGSYCNWARLAVKGMVHSPAYNFNKAPVQLVKKVAAC